VTVVTAVRPRRAGTGGLRVAGALTGTAQSQVALLQRRPRLLRPAVIDRLIDASRHHLRVDTARSRVLAESAAIVAGQLGDGERLGRSLRAQANALSVAGDNRAAVQLHDRALALLEAHGTSADVARTLAASIQPLILLGEYDRALAAAERARRLYEDAGDGKQLARLEINVGNIHHRQDRGEEALVCYERAFEQLRKLGDADGVFSALHNKAVTLIALHRFGDAEATYTAARELAFRQQLPLFVVQADYNIAWLYYLRGEYSRAIDLLHASAEVARRNRDAYHAALCLLDLSEIYLELNLSVDAREVAEEAIARFQDLGMRYEAAKAVANSAIAHGQEGVTARAVELFDEARKLFVAEQNHVWSSLVDLYEALLFFNEGRLFEARRRAVAALDVFSSPAYSGKRALCELLLARISLRLGDPRAAVDRCARVLDTLADGDRPIVRYHAHFLRGQAQVAAGDRTAARASYDAARATLETLRSHVRGEELKMAFVDNKLEVFECLVELGLDDDGSADAHAEAFRCVEEAKSRTLLELIFRPVPGAVHHAVAESELARTIRGLREELNSYYHLIEREQLQPADESPARLERFRREIGQREREYARVLREASAGAGDDRDSQLHVPQVFPADEVRAALPDDAVLVEFFQAHERVIACVLDRHRVQVAPIAVMSDVLEHVRLLRFQLSKFKLGPAYVQAFAPALLEATRGHLAALFRELMAPVWEAVRGRHAVIVPHSALHYIPFHALVDESGQYVAETTNVSYAPSASIYVLCERKRSAAARGALVLGIPDDRTPFIETEVREVAAALPDAKLFVGEHATSHALRTHGAGSRFVHIASHGVFRPESPMFSGVKLGDGHLNVHDLYHLDLPADLVTLSGCATGAAASASGDELLGISRGLFLAGARRLLLSLWDVADGTTANFMTHLYSSIASGAPVAGALSEAMREIRREHVHPYYWAPFALSGKVGSN
jgi:tetratricopeptide (TPR) repeat protein